MLLFLNNQFIILDDQVFKFYFLANYKISTFLMILLWFPIVSEAGEIDKVVFNNSGITINHHNCKLNPTIKSGKKLILPMVNCTSFNGQINISHPELQITRIHWEQHNPNTVWIVVTFSTEEYQFQISSFPNRYFLCISKCDQSKSKKTNRLDKATRNK